jgi:ABC-2 type transport system permease protein
MYVQPLILPGNGFTPAHGYQTLSLGDGAVLRAAAGSVLYLALIALLSLGTAILAGGLLLRFRDA